MSGTLQEKGAAATVESESTLTPAAKVDEPGVANALESKTLDGMNASLKSDDTDEAEHDQGLTISAVIPSVSHGVECLPHANALMERTHPTAPDIIIQHVSSPPSSPSSPPHTSAAALPSAPTSTVIIQTPAPALSIESSLQQISRSTETPSPVITIDHAPSQKPVSISTEEAAQNEYENARDDAASLYPASEPPQYFDNEKFANVVYKRLLQRVRSNYLFPLYLATPGFLILLVLGIIRGGLFNSPIIIAVFVMLGCLFFTIIFIYRSKVRRLDAMHAAGLLADTPMEELVTLVFQNRVLNPAPLYDADAMRWDEPLPYYGRGRSQGMDQRRRPSNPGVVASTENNLEERTPQQDDMSALEIGSITEPERALLEGSVNASRTPIMRISEDQDSSASLTQTHDHLDETHDDDTSLVSMMDHPARSPSLVSIPTNEAASSSSMLSSTPPNRFPTSFHLSPSRSSSSLANMSRGRRSPSVFQRVRRPSSNQPEPPTTPFPPVILPPNHVAFLQQQQDQASSSSLPNQGFSWSGARSTTSSENGTADGTSSGSTSPSRNPNGSRRRVRLNGAPTRERSPRRRGGSTPQGEALPTVTVEEGERNITIVELPTKKPGVNIVDAVIQLAAGPVRIGEARIDESRVEMVRREQMRAQLREHFVMQEILERRENRRRAEAAASVTSSASASTAVPSPAIVSPLATPSSTRREEEDVAAGTMRLLVRTGV
ncbi:hypothetical protein BC829DRAFT_395187 [Chytridium lagenaria]|nr:hypothetical protein BC829DRAFT_395187 [Chytridium lagenaria]